MLPGIGPVVNSGINMFNDTWYDDRISVSPVVTMLESAVRAPAAVYRGVTGLLEGEWTVRRRDVRDVLTLHRRHHGPAGGRAGAAARLCGRRGERGGRADRAGGRGARPGD